MLWFHRIGLYKVLIGSWIKIVYKFKCEWKILKKKLKFIKVKKSNMYIKISNSLFISVKKCSISKANIASFYSLIFLDILAYFE